MQPSRLLVGLRIGLSPGWLMGGVMPESHLKCLKNTDNTMPQPTTIYKIILLMPTSLTVTKEYLFPPVVPAVGDKIWIEKQSEQSEAHLMNHPDNPGKGTMMDHGFIVKRRVFNYADREEDSYMITLELGFEKKPSV